ncbi:MAG: DUF5119 domain-containing protein [Bacteroidaceae bacterium]|nr:DUF5119 domain-containing protein [Bacteroidaceae bacterium]
MNNKLHIFILALVTLITVSCERRPLLEISNTHYVRVYIDEEIKNVTCDYYNPNYKRPAYKAPDVMRVVLADPVSGAVRAERYLRDKGTDSKGTYYEGHILADPGQYALMAYNFDTEASLVKAEYNINEAKAYTNEIASHLRSKISSRADTDISGERIVYEPDHLFTVNCGEVTIPYDERVDTLTTADSNHFTAQSIVKSYYLQVQVKGIQYAASTVGLLTGLSGSSLLSNGAIDNNDSITVYFEMSPNETQSVGLEYQAIDGDGDSREEGVVTLYTTFNTFGKIPELKNNLQITFDFITTYGKSYSETFDITEAFATPEAINNRWLLIDHTIVIPEPPPVTGSGGFRPNVDDWDDINTDIKI